jgi:hypothetical protein
MRLFALHEDIADIDFQHNNSHTKCGGFAKYPF